MEIDARFAVMEIDARLKYSARTFRANKLMDTIFLHGLKIDCIIGVWEWERRIRQTVIVDLDMGFDIARAAKSDALADTLSYKDVAKRVTVLVRESEFNLVETLAEKIAALVLDEFPTAWCRVRVNKPGAVRGAGDVGVVVERAAPSAKKPPAKPAKAPTKPAPPDKN